MSEVLGPVAAVAALVVSAAAVLTGVGTLLATRRPALALSVFLDLLLAAGLLRLTGDPSWQALVTAASVVGIRRLVGAGLRSGARAWSPPSAPPAWSGRPAG